MLFYDASLNKRKNCRVRWRNSSHLIGEEFVGFSSDIFIEEFKKNDLLKSVKAKFLLGDAFERQ